MLGASENLKRSLSLSLPSAPPCLMGRKSLQLDSYTRICQGLKCKFLLAAVELNKEKENLLCLGRLFRDDPKGAMP